LVDYYDPEGRRVKRRFRKLADAQTFDASVKVSKMEGKYSELFGKNEEAPFLFSQLAQDYLAASRCQRSFEDNA
jgi:hypothetical protein